MRIETDTRLVYDDGNEKCLCIHSQSEGRVWAFIQCIDIGNDGTSEHIKRYWGAFDLENPEASIERIMRNGGKWPKLPA